MGGHGLTFAVGLVLLAAGVLVITRPAPSEQAVYARRIVGMMLIAGVGLTF